MVGIRQAGIGRSPESRWVLSSIVLFQGSVTGFGRQVMRLWNGPIMTPNHQGQEESSWEREKVKAFDALELT
jgi:hypothetical protein